MAWYVALIAIVNLGLGYALAVFLRSGREQTAWSTGDSYAEPPTASLQDST
jgi:hypothetical protein